ncbi:MAG: DUF1801 domain-containing protein [Ferruginibacter sp.]
MGKLAEIKTKPTALSVEDFIDAVEHEQKRKDSFILLKLIEKATKEKPKMWGSSIIGFGDKRFKSPSTEREVDWFKVGFSPRKTNLTLYFSSDIQLHTEALKKLGKHKVGSGCLYINKLADVDIEILEQMITATIKRM